MKKILFILLITMSYVVVKSQDKIITVQNDTIECRIISVNAERISYEQKSLDNKFIGKTISSVEVLQYIRSEKSDKAIGNNSEKPYWKKPESRWMFSLQGGLSHTFNDYNDFKNQMNNNVNSVSDIENYIGNLKNGYYINTSAYYLLTNFLGIGGQYAFFHSEANGEFLIRGVDESGHNFPVYNTFSLDEKLYIHFAGASVLFIQHPDKRKKIRISEDITPGIVFFRDESRNMDYEVYWGNSDYYVGFPPQYYEYANALSTSKSFGLKGGLKLEYCISPKFSAGLTGSILWSKIHKISIDTRSYNLENQELNKTIDISRIDYGISVHYVL